MQPYRARARRSAAANAPATDSTTTHALLSFFLPLLGDITGDSGGGSVRGAVLGMGLREGEGTGRGSAMTVRLNTPGSLVPLTARDREEPPAADDLQCACVHAESFFAELCILLCSQGTVAHMSC